MSMLPNTVRDKCAMTEFNRTCFQLIIIRLTFLPNRKVFTITLRSKISGWRFGYLACLANATVFTGSSVMSMLPNTVRDKCAMTDI
jgi:hypothetical protein